MNMNGYRRGNKQNALLNREWGNQNRFGKKLTSRRRRLQSKAEIKSQVKELVAE